MGHLPFCSRPQAGQGLSPISHPRALPPRLVWQLWVMVEGGVWSGRHRKQHRKGRLCCQTSPSALCSGYSSFHDAAGIPLPRIYG